MTTTTKYVVGALVLGLLWAIAVSVLVTSSAESQEHPTDPPIIPGPECPAPLGRLDAEQIDQSRGGECWCLAPGQVGFFGWVGVDGYEGRDPAECGAAVLGPATTITNEQPDDAYPLDPPPTVPPSPPAQPVAGQPTFTG